MRQYCQSGERKSISLSYFTHPHHRHILKSFFQIQKFHTWISSGSNVYVYLISVAPSSLKDWCRLLSVSCKMTKGNWESQDLSIHISSHLSLAYLELSCRHDTAQIRLFLHHTLFFSDFNERRTIKIWFSCTLFFLNNNFLTAVLS